jgi:hypothetical protein
MSVWHELKQILSDAYHVIALLNPGGGSKPGGDQDAIRAAAKVWGEQYRTLSDISSLLDSTVVTHLRSGAVPAGTGSIGIAQAWNDPAGDMFQSYWRNVKAGIDNSASAFNQMPGALNEVAQHVEGFNNSVNSVRGQLEWWVGITGVLVLLGFVTDGATDAVAALRLAEGLSLLARGKALLSAAKALYEGARAWKALRYVVTAFDVFKAILKNETIVFGTRLAERWAINGDPSAGWSKYDPVQILTLGSFLAGFNGLIALGDKGGWLPRIGTGATTPTFNLITQKLFYNLIWRPSVSVLGGLTYNNLQAVLLTHARDYGKISATTFKFNSLNGLLAGVTALIYPKLPIAANTTGLVIINSAEEVAFPKLRLARGLYVITAAKDLGRVQPALFQPTPAGLMPIGTLPMHHVAPGDNLWSLAQQRYGNGLYYQDLAEANRIQNPNLIYPGQFLTLPGVPLAPAMPAPGDQPGTP